MSWRYLESSVDHALPLGVSERATVGQEVVAGGTIAVGTAVRAAVRVSGARRLGVSAEDLIRVLRVTPGDSVARGAVLARTGRRFARVVTAPFDGRLVHVSAEGDLWLAPEIDRWLVRSTMSGVVTASTEGSVTVTGRSWCLGAVAAYGPDAVGELAIGVASADEELSPHRVDVRLRDRIVLGGARIAAEAVTRAHACGVAGLVASAAPAGGLRVVYGDDVAAAGGPTREDRPTLLCLAGFGGGPLPPEVFGPLAAFAGSLASIHVASARLFVFAPPEAVATAGDAPGLVLAGDFASVAAQDRVPGELTHARFASEYEGPAFVFGDNVVPEANALPFDAVR